MDDRPLIKVELRACSACGAVVVDEDRHFEWHAAIRAGAGRALDFRPDYELVGLIDAVEDEFAILPNDPTSGTPA